MTAVQEIPPAFTVRSTLGIFVMQMQSEGVYEGGANGFVLNICLEITNKHSHYMATLISDNERWDIASAEIDGNFSNISDMVSLVESWVDNTCSEAIEDYAADVEYLETPNGKIAWWGYNTHLDSIPLVFVHGGPGGDSNPVKARRLHVDNPVYLFDQMGCGLSDPVRDLSSWKIEDYIEDMKCFIDSIPSDKVVLVGASWGAGLCVSYTSATKMHKVAAMILPSPFLSARIWSEDAMENLRSMGENYYEVVSKCIADNDFGDAFVKALGEYNARFLFNRSIYRDYALAAASEEPNEVFKTLCGPNDLVTDGKLKDFDVVGELVSIDVPVLLMCADSDEVTLDRMMQYRKMIKGSRLSVIPHAGHVLALEQFDSYRSAIGAFLEENGF